MADEVLLRRASPKLIRHMKKLAAERDDLVYVDGESCKPRGIKGDGVIIGELDEIMKTHTQKR